MFADSSVGTHWQRQLINRRAKSPAGHQQGISIVEVMVSITIGLLVLSFLVSIFANSSNTRREIDKSADIYENGRYALLVLGDELSHAGYYGTLSTVSPGATTDLPCSTTVADWVASLALAVRGSNHSDTGATLALFSCINGSRKSVRYRCALCTTRRDLCRRRGRLCGIGCERPLYAGVRVRCAIFDQSVRAGRQLGLALHPPEEGLRRYRRASPKVHPPDLFCQFR